MEWARLIVLCAILLNGHFQQQPASSSEISTANLGKVKLNQSNKQMNEEKKSLKKKRTTTTDVENSASEKKSASSRSGNISIKAHLAPMGSVDVLINHMWTKGGYEADPNEIGATRDGLIWKATIKNGETKTFEVAAGKHEIVVSDDLYASEELTVEVLPGETQRLECGNQFKRAKKVLYKIADLFNRECGVNYYYIRKVSVNDDHE